jgi:hypothetical protein
MQHDGSATVATEPAKAAIARAFASWQAVRCPTEQEPPAIEVRTSFGDAQCHRHEYNQTDGNANIVMFRDGDWPYTTSALALTTVTFNPSSGDIYDADMEINATVQLSVSESPAPYDFDLQSIVTHEAGHFLGLDHSLDPSATMTAHYTPGTDSFRELSPDDIAGICAIYPPRTRQSCQEEPRQGFSPTCGIAPTSGGSCGFAPQRLGTPRALGGLPVAALLAGTAFRLQRRRRRNRAVSV